MVKAVTAVAVAALALLATGSAQPRTHASNGPLGLVGDGTTSSLVQLNAKNLRPVPGRRLDLGLFAGAWAYSPDRANLALGLNGPAAEPQASLRFVEVATLSSQGNLPLGPGYFYGAAWLASDRLAAITDHADEVELWVVDPSHRRIVSTTALPDAPIQTRQAGDHLLVLSRGAVPILTIVDGRGSVRDLKLDRLGGGLQALAVTPDGRHAYVAAPSGLIADVNTGSLSIAYHGPLGDLTSSRSSAEVLPTGQLAVAGWRQVHYVDSIQNRTRFVGTGLILVDTGTWSAQRVDYSSARIAVVGKTMLATGSAWGGGTFYFSTSGTGPPRPVGDGLTSYSLSGSPRFHRFNGKDVYVDQTYEKRSFVSVDNAGAQLQVVDVRTGKVVGTRALETLPWILQGASSTR